MKRGEKVVFGLIGLVLVAGAIRSHFVTVSQQDKEIPFYSTAPAQVATEATDVIRKYNCKSCHSLWTLKDTTQAVPAPMLDGIGSLRTEQWLHNYLSSTNPQAIVPSRLKPEYRMPYFADMTNQEREVLVSYLASLKVKDWYLEETKKLEYEKLTGLKKK